jgi:SAM-dependent methyltransferase
MNPQTKNPYFKMLEMVSSDFRNFDFFLLTSYCDLLRGSIQTRVSKEANFSTERFFWARFFRDRKKRFGYVSRSKSDSASFLTTEAIFSALAELEKYFPTPLSLIDVGSGPFSAFNIENLIKRSDLKIVTVDPLADFYKELHRKFQTKYRLNCIKGYGEKLDELFKEERFHLAITENALDHAMNPKLFITKLLDVVKPGGYLILTGYVNNGSNERWQGLHKWNIEVINGELILSNQSNTTYENILTGLSVSPIRRIVKKGDIYKGDVDTYCFAYVKNSNIG